MKEKNSQLDLSASHLLLLFGPGHMSEAREMQGATRCRVCGRSAT
jgi:hypothetical protein